MTSTKPRRQWLPTLPILDWGRRYDRATLAGDLTAALIVTIMLIPQSLAYAMLAGLPLEVGLYACIAPLLLYTIFGSSRVLAVGPVAVVSLMTATAIGSHATAGSPMYWSIALTLAFLSGTMLLLMGVFRLGFLANFLSTPVISGFITASALLIAASQLKTLMGVTAEGHNFIELIASLIQEIPQTHELTLMIGVFALFFLLAVRLGLKKLLVRWGIAEKMASGITRTAPVFLISLTILLAWIFQWHAHGVKIVGTIPQGLPPLTVPLWDMALWNELALPALLISVVGFVESVSIGQTLATQRRQRIEPNQELVALGIVHWRISCYGRFCAIRREF
jgi:sulfate permease, SulP family